MDNMVKKIAALGVPGVILVIAMEMTGYAGAVAITTALSALGPGGILGGIATLGVIGLISEGIAEFGAEAIAKRVILELYAKGENKVTIKDKIKKYPISRKLKSRLNEIIGGVE